MTGRGRPERKTISVAKEYRISELKTELFDTTDELKEGRIDPFSDEEKRWILEQSDAIEAELECKPIIKKSSKQRKKDSERRASIKKKFKSATATLDDLFLILDTFTDNEIEEMLPPTVLANILKLLTFRKGLMDTTFLVRAINEGISNRIEIDTKGYFTAQVQVTLLPIRSGKEMENALKY